MNEIQSKFRSEKFIKYATIVTVMALTAFWLASCSPSVGDGGRTPTMPLPNTETPTATATPTETPTPTITPTPTEIVLSPETILNMDLDIWGMSIDNYNVGYDKDGKIELRAKGSNKLIYWDNRWSGDLTIEMIKSTNNCEPTDFVPTVTGGNWVTGPQEDAFAKYRQGLINEYIASDLFEAKEKDLKKVRFMTIYLGKQLGNCWAAETEIVFNDERVLDAFIWRDNKGKLKILHSFNQKYRK